MAAFDFHRNIGVTDAVAHVIYLAIVRVGEHTFRGAREIAHQAEWIAWAGRIRASLCRQIAKFAAFLIALIDGNRLPNATDAYATRQQTAILANQSGCLAFATLVRRTC